METTNRPEQFNHHRLQCYAMTLSLAKQMPTLIQRWPMGTGYLQDQLRRALSSVLLNISEGNGRSGPADRKRFFTIARGSATEVASVMDIASAYGYISSEAYAHWQAILLQVVKILYKLR